MRFLFMIHLCSQNLLGFMSCGLPLTANQPYASFERNLHTDPLHGMSNAYVHSPG